MNVGFETSAQFSNIPRRFRILQCLRAPVGGLFRHVCDLSVELAQRGHAVGVVCDRRGVDGLSAERLTQLEKHLALGLHRIPMNRQIGVADLAGYRAIRTLAEASKVEIIHGHGAKGGGFARLVAGSFKKFGRDVACFYTPHGGSLHYDPASLAGRIYMAIERRLAPSTDAIIFESAYAANRYACQVGQVTCPSRTIPNGLGPEDFRKPDTSATATDFLFVGELRHLKGVDVMLEALARVRSIRPVRATIVGTGPDAAALKSLSRQLEVDDSVDFPGAMPVAEAFRLGRIIVVPSRAESFPYIVLEAAASGLPLLATDVGGIGEIVKGTGIELLPGGDIASLTEAMLKVLSDPKTAVANAQRLRDAVAKRFTIAAMTDGVLDLYAALAAAPSAEAASR